MTLWKQLALFVFILATLVLIERRLAIYEDTARLKSQRIATFIPPELVKDRGVAGIRLTGRGNPTLFVYHENLWRCIGFNAAPGLHSRLNLLWPAVTEARGVIQSTNPQDAATYGFNENNSFQLTYCGPNVLEDPAGDIIIAIDIGNSIESTGGCFARLTDSNDIWAIDIDFRKIINFNADSALPALVDPRIIPEAWNGFREPFRSFTIARTDEPPMLFQRHEPDATNPRGRWTIQHNDQTLDAIEAKIMTFAQFLAAAEFMGLPAPRKMEEYGFDTPRGSLTIQASDGRVLELVIGNFGPHGGVVVLNKFSATIYEVTRPLAEALLPAMNSFTQPTEASPWDEWVGGR